MITDNDQLILPELLTRRWQDCKTFIYNLAYGYEKYDLIKALLKDRETHTVAPNLSEITSFTGYDNAILSIMKWDWKVEKDNSTVDMDAAEIGKFGGELMILHTIKESIRNELLRWEDGKLVETDFGRIHFSNLNSFNVEITGSRIDIARKRFSQGRLSKMQRKLDPINEIPSVKRLYWENSIIMLLRSPIPFYRAMQALTHEQQELLLDFHSKLIKKLKKRSEGLVKIRILEDSKIALMLDRLTPVEDKDERRPRFTACIKSKNKEDEETNNVEYFIGIGALSMFSMFLMGFTRKHMDEKSKRAEIAVSEVIEATGYWKVIDSNAEVIIDRNEVITEIDIIAQSTSDPNQWLTFEVKDFSFWKGWMWRQGTYSRREYYEKAVKKLPIKEEYIKQKYGCTGEIQSYIVTSIPESYASINDIQLIYLSDLTEFLLKLSGHDVTSRKKHSSSNFLIRYFERLQIDYEKSNKLDREIRAKKRELNDLKEELEMIKTNYEETRQIYKSINSDYETLKVSHKLISKRLVKDTGEKHYILEKEYDDVKRKIAKVKKDVQIKAQNLREIKDGYSKKLNKYKTIEAEIAKFDRLKMRNIGARTF